MSTDHRNEQDALEELLLFAGRREAVEPFRAERVEKNVVCSLAEPRWNEQRRAKTTSSRKGSRRFPCARRKSCSGDSHLRSGLHRTSRLHGRDAGRVRRKNRGWHRRSTNDAVRHRDPSYSRGAFLRHPSGAGASLLLQTRSQRIRIAAASRVRLQPETIMLDKGRIYIDSGRYGTQ